MNFYEPEILSLNNTNKVLDHLLKLDSKVLSDCVFRGHNDTSWGLQSSLDRYGNSNPEVSIAKLREPKILEAVFLGQALVLSHSGYYSDFFITHIKKE